ncbi:MAG: phage terminase large subunit [Chlorobiaceae bacterium]
MNQRFGVDKGRMLPHQRAFWELPNFVKLLIGGYGSGKTRIGALRSIWNSYINAPLPHLQVSPTYKQARKTIVVSIAGLLDNARIRHLYNKSNHEFFIPGWNGTVWIGSGDDPDSLKGPNLGTAGIDEPFLIDGDILNVVLSRLRDPNAKIRELFLTGTPEQLNWGYELAQNIDGRYDLGTVVARTADNTYLPAQFISMLEKAFDENQRAAYMNGQFVNLTAGRVYKYFDSKSCLVVRPKLEGYHYQAGIDFNVDNLTAEIFSVFPDGSVHFFEEIHLTNSTTYELADLLYERYPSMTVFPDPAGRARKSSSDATDFNILKGKGFRVEARPAHPPVRGRVNAVNKLLREGKLTVGNCPHLIKDFELVSWKGGDIDKRNEGLTHASDAAGYAIEKLFPVRMPTREYRQPTSWRV